MPNMQAAMDALGGASAAGSEEPAYGQRQNMQDRKEAFFEGSDGREQEYVTRTVAPPISRFEIKAGSVIPVILVTAINSDLPGNVGQNISRAGDQITKKNLGIQSTLNNIGWKKVNILVNKDMVLSPCNERG